MMFAAKLIATCLGIGYIKKGAGTVAALVCCVVWYLLLSGKGTGVGPLVFTLLVMVLGTLASHMVDREWGKDSNRVVVDELLGMSIALLFVPVTLFFVGLAFVLFRFFDILKPLYIRKAESLKGGWGVMADDVLAGIYTNILLQAVVKSGLV